VHYGYRKRKANTPETLDYHQTDSRKDTHKRVLKKWELGEKRSNKEGKHVSKT